MAKVHNFLQMWMGCQTQRGTQKKSCTQNKQMTAVVFILDTEDILKAYWSLFQHDGVAVFKLSERSPLPPAMSAKDLPWGQTQIINVRWLRRNNCLPVQGDEDCALESILDIENWLNWNGDLDNPINSNNDWAAGNESDVEQPNRIEDLECPAKRDVSAAPNVPRLIQPIRKSKKQTEKVLLTVNIIGMRRNKGVKKRLNRMHQCFTCVSMWLDREFQLEIYYGQMASSWLWILVDKQMYSRRNESICKIYKFYSCESKQCKIVPVLGFAPGPSLNLSDRQLIRSNHDENDYGWQEMLNREYIKFSVNGASIFCDLVSTVIEQWFGCCYA